MFPFADLVTAFRLGAARRSATRTLSRLSAAQLRDIGLAYDDIDDVVSDMLAARRSQPAVAVPVRERPLARGAALQGCG